MIPEHVQSILDKQGIVELRTTLNINRTVVVAGTTGEIGLVTGDERVDGVSVGTV